MHLQVKSLKELLKGLAAYVKQYHATGPAWQPSGIPISKFRPGAQASSGKSLSAQVLRGKIHWSCYSRDVQILFAVPGALSGAGG